MGKTEKKRLLERTIEDLVLLIEKGYTPRILLGDLLGEFYDSAIGNRSKIQVLEAQAKIIQVLEDFKSRGGQYSLAYEIHLRNYQKLCQELRISERPVNAPLKIESAADSTDTKTESENLEVSDGKNHRREKLICMNFVTSIADIQQGKLKPRYYLERGLSELHELALAEPFQRNIFKKALGNYVNVMDYIEEAELHKDMNFDSLKREYGNFVRELNGRLASRRDGRGIGRRALEGGARSPARDFRKTSHL